MSLSVQMARQRRHDHRTGIDQIPQILDEIEPDHVKGNFLDGKKSSDHNAVDFIVDPNPEADEHGVGAMAEDWPQNFFPEMSPRKPKSRQKTADEVDLEHMAGQ